MGYVTAVRDYIPPETINITRKWPYPVVSCIAVRQLYLRGKKGATPTQCVMFTL